MTINWPYVLSNEDLLKQFSGDLQLRMMEEQPLCNSIELCDLRESQRPVDLGQLRKKERSRLGFLSWDDARIMAEDREEWKGRILVLCARYNKKRAEPLLPG